MKDLGKLIVGWFGFIAALFFTGAVVRAFHLSMTGSLDRLSVAGRLLVQLGAGALLVLGLYPLARRLTGAFLCRSIALGGFLLLALGLNGMIEARVFSSVLVVRLAGAIVFFALVAVFVGAAMGWLFGTEGEPAGFPHRGWRNWSGRGIAAWLAWPVIYFLFGMMVSPIVLPYYRAGVAGLHIPPLSTIVLVQLVRSLVFLFASLPFLALWRGSRGGLWFALGLALMFVGGVYGLAGATFLPWVLRLTHCVEIGCDSFAYAGLLVLLFTAPVARSQQSAIRRAA